MFWERFYALCEKEGIKPNPLGKKLGIASGTITQWKNGVEPSSDKLKQLAAYFNVSTDYLLGNKTDGSGKNNVVLAKDEQELLNDYRLLNDLGKNEARKRINELTKLEQYKSSDDSEEEIFISVAARKASTNNRKLKKRNSNIKLSDLPDYKG